jgi:hypothetical protein
MPKPLDDGKTSWREWHAAVSLDATLVEVYRDRGLLFEQKGDKDRALAEYRKALALKARWVIEHRAQDEALVPPISMPWPA